MDINTVLQQMDILRVGESLELSPEEMQEICKATFPRRASTFLNSEESSFYIEPRPWHHIEFAQTLKDICEKEGCSIYQDDYYKVTITREKIIY
jgi:hypothetical protein